MKSQALLATLKDIIGGTPAEVFAKIIAAAIAAFWANLQVIGLALFGYFIIILFDAWMGSRIAKKNGKPFDFTYFVSGPAYKLFLTTGMLLTGSIVDSIIPNGSEGWMDAIVPDAPLFFTLSAFIGITAALDATKKYGFLMNNRIADWIEAKLGKFTKFEDEQQP